jgi:hypothetical protein
MKIIIVASTALMMTACYASSQAPGDAAHDEDGDAAGDHDVRPDQPDYDWFDIPSDVDCDQVVCIDCECQCPDGSWLPLGGCYSVCEPIPECPAWCPPDYCPWCTEPPPCPDGPPDSTMGDPCTSRLDCEAGADCYNEQVEHYGGETYVTWPGGYCARYGTGGEGCDPAEPATCPEGSTCIYLGMYMSRDWYGCFDACSPADSSDAPYDWACGCREGYQCYASAGICLSGCSNDRECCEFWNDANTDGMRESDEITFFPDCDGSYACIYPGNPGARIGDSCQHDYQCTPGGTCLSSLSIDPETGEPYYPGGYCTILECDLRGRECAPYGGVCANFSGQDYRNYMCVTPCDVGTSPETPGYKCRSTPIEEAQACFPAWPGTFTEDPPAGEDGFCWYGSFTPGTKGIGEVCSSDGECASPFGLGSCMTWFGEPAFCTVSCNGTLVRINQICGGAGSGGVAEGVCAWNYCWEGCGDLTAPPGSNGCTDPQMACAPLYILGSTTYVPEGSTRPLGVCMSPCSTDVWCQSTFGPSRTCDPVTHACR